MVSMEIIVFWDVTQYTSVKQKLADSIIRVHSSTLMMGVAGPSVMLVYFYQTTRCHIPEAAVFNGLVVLSQNIRMSCNRKVSLTCRTVQQTINIIYFHQILKNTTEFFFSPDRTTQNHTQDKLTVDSQI